MTPNIWIIIFGLGIGSWALRFSFLGIIGSRKLPDWVLRHLRYTAVAIMPGLVAPLVLWPEATQGALDPARLSAAIVALTIGVYTRNVLLAVGAGGLVLYLGLYLTA